MCSVNPGWAAHKFKDHKQNVHITLIRLHVYVACEQSLSAADKGMEWNEHGIRAI